jgi:hypothetical protein
MCTPYQLFNRTVQELLTQHKSKERLTYHQLRLLQTPENWNLVTRKDGSKEFRLQEGNHLWRIFYDLDQNKWIFVDPITVPVSPVSTLSSVVTRVPTTMSTVSTLPMAGVAPFAPISPMTTIPTTVTPTVAVPPSVVVQPSLVTTRNVVQGISRYIR